MNCPRCQTAPLEELDRDGVIVDACRTCRGLWLDRGELEKLIARATRELDELDRRLGDRDRDRDRERDREWDRDRDRHDFRYRDDDYHRYPRRKKRWFEALGDIFD